jgi:hypothetical protein
VDRFRLIGALVACVVGVGLLVAAAAVVHVAAGLAVAGAALLAVGLVGIDVGGDA